MRISLRWLRDYAPLDAPLQTIAQALVDTGTEVDTVRRDAEGTVVARVLALSPVPESTRNVQLADIDAGGPEPVRVVTGAQNLRVGDLVPYAPPGTWLPGWDEPLGVRAMFRGKYHSPGMICSAVELGTGDDADGILVLDHGTPGRPVHEVLDLDAALEVDVTPNRPDCLCHVGIARELAAALQEPLREPAAEVADVLESATPVEGRVTVQVDDPVGCPRFAVRVIEDVTVRPSPGWLQRRLRAVGMRPVNNVVDVTNYVAAELGQPLHAFDLDRFRALAGDDGKAEARVVVRRARRGETLRCLDDVERALDPDDLVVCAGERAASVAGVIGGGETAIDQRSHTVLLEAASWDGPTIRATSRRLGVRTDASTRFEKGLSDTLPPLALERAASLIAELGGGHVLRGRVDVHDRPLPPIEPIAVAEGYLERLLGCRVDISEAATALARLGFGVEQEGGALVVTPPHFRRDVVIPADVAEEVGRSLGYDRIPSTLPGRRTPVTTLAPVAPLDDRVRDVCVGAGFDEAITYSFVSTERAQRLPGAGGRRAPIALRNPLSEDWAVLRTSLLPGLCDALAVNLNRGVTDVALFEVGRAYWEGERRVPPQGSLGDGVDDSLPPLPGEPLMLAMVSQAGDGEAESAAHRLRHAQSVIAWLSHDLGVPIVTARPRQLPGFRPGRTATLESGGREVGIIGELDEDALGAFSLRGRVVAAEVRLDSLTPETPRTLRYRQPPRLPAVVQDLSVVVPDTELAGEALEVVRQAGGTLLESAELYDEFRDASRLGDDLKAWTFRLTYRAPDRTLTGEEAQSVQAAIETALVARCRAEVRR